MKCSNCFVTNCSSIESCENIVTQSQQRKQLDDNQLTLRRQFIEADGRTERLNGVTGKRHNNDGDFGWPKYDNVHPGANKCWKRTPEFVLLGKRFV